MKKIFLLFLLLLSIGEGVNAQVDNIKIDTLKIDVDTIQKKLFIGVSNKNLRLFLETSSSFYIVDSLYFSGLQATFADVQDLVTLYESKDKIRVDNITALKLSFEKLYKEYTDITSKVYSRVTSTNRQLSVVQSNLKQASQDIKAAQTGIVSAKTEVSNASTQISSAQKEIKDAIIKLESVKKGNGFWIPALAGAGGLLLGILIGKK
jgi:hypothetical protein